MPTESQVLNANTANAVIWMVIVLAGTLVVLAKIFAPPLDRIAGALTMLAQATNEQKASNELQTASIEELRKDFDRHMVTINLRFDNLPSDLRNYLMAEIARENTRRGGAPNA